MKGGRAVSKWSYSGHCSCEAYLLHIDPVHSQTSSFWAGTARTSYHRLVPLWYHRVTCFLLLCSSPRPRFLLTSTHPGSELELLYHLSYALIQLSVDAAHSTGIMGVGQDGLRSSTAYIEVAQEFLPPTQQCGATTSKEKDHGNERSQCIIETQGNITFF